MVSTIIYKLVIPKFTGLASNFKLPGWSSESVWMDIVPWNGLMTQQVKMELAIFSLNFLSSGNLGAVKTEMTNNRTLLPTGTSIYSPTKKGKDLFLGREDL